MKNKIALVLPYYGKVAPYFGLFLKSLKRIKLDVLLVTDLSVEVPQDLENLKVIKMTFEELRELVRRVLDSHAKLSSVRKICDYKPFYGKLFEQQLIGYDYWAHGDCDLIYGEKFNEILDKIIADSYDVASMRKHWMSGSFSAFRNNERMRNMYKEFENWREVCANENCLNFDECITVRFEELCSGTFTIEDCYHEAGDSLSALIWRTKDLKFYHEEVMCEDSLSQKVISYENGRIFLEDQEVPAFHYIGLKYRRYFSYVNVPYDKVGETYWIDDTGFYMSRFAYAMRPLVRIVKKARAFVASVRDNGIKHWWNRLRGRNIGG